MRATANDILLYSRSPGSLVGTLECRHHEKKSWFRDLNPTRVGRLSLTRRKQQKRGRPKIGESL